MKNLSPVEFGVWCGVGLLPVLWWVNGTSVSPDQLVVRIAVCVAAITFGIGLRWKALRQQPVGTEPPDHCSARRTRHRRMLFGLLAFQAIASVWCAGRNSFCWTEAGLIPSGIIDWQYGDFAAYRVNPPLLRMWGTLPLLAVDPDIPYQGYSSDPRHRCEWDVARSMVETRGRKVWGWLFIARLMVIPLSLLGTCAAYQWAGRMFGRDCGIGAAALFVFNPLLLGYGHLMSGDAQAATMGMVTLFVFRNWLSDVRFSSSYLLGVCTGVTVLTKTSWFALFGLLPLLWLLIRFLEYFRRRRSISALNHRKSGSLARRALRETAFAVGSMLSCLLVINLAYGFTGSLKPLGEYEFISKALAGSENWESYYFSGNRFVGTCLESVPVPLPEPLVIGMDLQKWDFDRVRWSYFFGEWRGEGWWYYYLFGLLVKTPIAFWLMGGVALMGAIVTSSWRENQRDFLILLLPGVLILTAASAETGLNRHVRYVLPVVPLMIILASRVFLVFRKSREIHRALPYFVTACLAWLAASSLWIYPHSHSYFNEITGGPLNAHHFMNASNLDWGQDLKYVDVWAKRNPEKRPLWVKAYLHVIDPREMGINSSGPVPSMPSADRIWSSRNKTQERFRPGWYAIDRETMLRRNGDFDYLKSLQPLDHAGYGFRIYEVTPEFATELNEQVSRAKVR